MIQVELLEQQKVDFSEFGEDLYLLKVKAESNKKNERINYSLPYAPITSDLLITDPFLISESRVNNRL